MEPEISETSDQSPAIDPPVDPYDERPDRDPREPVDYPDVEEPQEDPDEPPQDEPIEDPLDAPGVGEPERRDPDPGEPPMQV
jgi:hypothetical protein